MSCLVVSAAIAGTAHADEKVWGGPGLEVGGFVGAHLFNDDIELGVIDGTDRDHPKTSAAFGARLGYTFNWLLGVEGELVMMPTEATDGSASLFGLGWRAHAVVNLLRGRVQPFVVGGIGALSVISSDADVIDDDTDLQFHTGLGARIWLGDSWGIRADARLLFPPRTQDESVTTDWEFTAGVFTRFGSSAPPPPKDSDGDGIMDDTDQCVSKPEDFDGFQDEDGCPELDNDGDGISDASDQCPDVPELVNQIDDADGCPEDDKDGDGIVGSRDKCPDEPEDKDGFEDEDGCPDLDNDGDGVPDATDKCPAELETKNEFEDDDGCPDVVPVAVKKFTGAIKGIQFKLGSDEIRSSSFAVLDAAVKVLTEYKGVQLEIQGHTDTTGSAGRNTELSQLRAEAVKNYLVSKGIDASRLTATGYGQDKPIADNSTKTGRTENRRVEFVLR